MPLSQNDRLQPGSAPPERGGRAEGRARSAACLSFAAPLCARAPSAEPGGRDKVPAVVQVRGGRGPRGGAEGSVGRRGRAAPGPSPAPPRGEARPEERGLCSPRRRRGGPARARRCRVRVRGGSAGRALPPPACLGSARGRQESSAAAGAPPRRRLLGRQAGGSEAGSARAGRAGHPASSRAPRGTSPSSPRHRGARPTERRPPGPAPAGERVVECGPAASEPRPKRPRAAQRGRGPLPGEGPGAASGTARRPPASLRTRPRRGPSAAGFPLAAGLREGLGPGAETRRGLRGRVRRVPEGKGSCGRAVPPGYRAPGAGPARIRLGACREACAAQPRGRLPLCGPGPAAALCASGATRAEGQLGRGGGGSPGAAWGPGGGCAGGMGGCVPLLFRFCAARGADSCLALHV